MRGCRKFMGWLFALPVLGIPTSVQVHAALVTFENIREAPGFNTQYAGAGAVFYNIKPLASDGSLYPTGMAEPWGFSAGFPERDNYFGRPMIAAALPGEYWTNVEVSVISNRPSNVYAYQGLSLHPLGSLPFTERDPSPLRSVPSGLPVRAVAGFQVASGHVNPVPTRLQFGGTRVDFLTFAEHTNFNWLVAIDNLSFTRVIETPPAVPYRIVIDHRNFPRPTAPSRQIILGSSTPSLPESSVAERKPDWAADAAINRRFSEKADALDGLPLPSGVVGRFLSSYVGAVSKFTALNAQILEKYAQDPPRDDFHLLATYSVSGPDPGFAAAFGPSFAQLDLMFREWDAAIRTMELGLTTLERMQGALLASDLLSFQRQSDHLAFALTEADNLLARVKTRLETSMQTLSVLGIPNYSFEGDTTLFSLIQDAAAATDRARFAAFSPAAPVPEPSTWALMLVGLAFVGFVAHRRRKPQAAA